LKEGSDNHSLVNLDEAVMQRLPKWLPMAVVLCIVGGFVALSWYAYHAGNQSTKDEDLLVIEADKTPMKEKPTDSGGMKFPNQDKTIFDTFAGNPQPVPKVERVLPGPEEPMTKDEDTSDTSTWVNDKLKNRKQENPSASEKIIGTEPKKPEVIPSAPRTDKSSNEHQVIAANTLTKDDQSETYIANKTPAKAAPQLEVKPVTPPAKPVEKPVVKIEPPKKEEAPKAEPSKAAAPATGVFAVQLGAYRSEAEATEAWNKMHANHSELADKGFLIVKADLGERGIYYRLRATGLASVADAKALCKSLAAKGQACILPTDK